MTDKEGTDFCFAPKIDIGPPEGMELDVGEIKLNLEGLDDLELPPIAKISPAKPADKT